MRVPVLVGHAEAVWVETEGSPEHANELLAASRRSTSTSSPRPPGPPAATTVLIRRVRRDPTVEHGLAFLVVGDNLRKGAALAVQIAELQLERAALADPSTAAAPTPVPGSRRRETGNVTPRVTPDLRVGPAERLGGSSPFAEAFASGLPSGEAAP
jgi:hypothetical protein